MINRPWIICILTKPRSAAPYPTGGVGLADLLLVGQPIVVNDVTGGSYLTAKELRQLAEHPDILLALYAASAADGVRRQSL